RRHAEYYLALAHQAEPKPRGPEQHLWFRRLAREHDNLRAGLAWSQTPEADGELGLRLGVLTWQFWSANAFAAELPQAFEQRLPREATSAVVGAQALGDLAVITLYQGEIERAVELARQGLDLARDSGDGESLVLACTWLGSAVGYQGDYAEARGLCQEALQ